MAIDYGDKPTDVTCERVSDGVYRLDHRRLPSFWAEVELVGGPPGILDNWTPDLSPAHAFRVITSSYNRSS